MQYVFLNLKRFDIPSEYGGVNRLAPITEWSNRIVHGTQERLLKYTEKAEFSVFFPESHLITAMKATIKNSPIQIGCQSVHRDDTVLGGNFGAFTASRTANAMRAVGCKWTIIGHCEERQDKLEIIRAGGGTDESAVNRLLNAQIKCAVKAGLKVLYCIGETADQKREWQYTLRGQLRIGLEGVDCSNIVVAYEPVWAIGPGKTPPDRDYIQEIARFVKDETRSVPIVYGGGLKIDNAAMLASIPEINGGLIALTRFSGDIGFYPDEYLEIIKTYLEG